MKIDEWVCTDPDTKQYIKYLGHRTYHCIDIIAVAPPEEVIDAYTVQTAYIDLEDYTDEEIEEAVSVGYDSVEAMLKSYGIGKEGRKLTAKEELLKDDLVAEYVFESSDDYGGCTYGAMSLSQAEEFVENYILKN